MEVDISRLFVVLLFCGLCVKELDCAPKKQCVRLTLRNGRVRYRPKTFAQFSCSRGYLLLGDRYSKCTDGEWDNPLPACIRPSCKLPKPPQFGMIYPSYKNALLRFFCMPDYEVTGPSYAYCDGIQWSTHLPSCLPSNITASISCDFETADICGWTHDLNHNFDWERQNLKTPSGHIGTGPKFDHTRGAGGAGYYMYIESSTRNYNDTARLISPVHKKQQSNTCLEFYYHMYGSGIGELRVYLKRVNDSWTLDPEKAIFSISGNQGDVWFRGFVNMGGIDDDFQIIFEGVRGISYISDIAIDDVKLIEDCRPETTIFTTEHYYSTQSIMEFESCTDRCFVKSTNQTRHETDKIACDCDEDCEENNSCCPDFASVCITDSTDATDETTYEGTTTEQPTDQPTMPTTKKTTSPTTVPTIRPSTTKSTTRTSQSTTKLTPSTTFTTRTTTTMATTPRKTSRPTIKQVVPTQRLTPTSSTTKLTTQTTRATTKSTTTEKPTSKVTTEEATTWSFRKHHIGETEKDATFQTIRYIDDVVPLTDPTSSQASTDYVELVEAERKTPEVPSNVGTVKVVIGLVVGVILLLGAVFLAKRVNYRRCYTRRMRNNNGDSQSDVRFLTSDEILDFTVAKPSQY